MPKRTRPHHDALLEYLQDPRAAAHYLNAALEDSDEMALVALRNVAESGKMSAVAKQAGISRESIYRMLCESGNPTYQSFTAILRALGLRIAFEPDIVTAGPTPEEKPSGETETHVVETTAASTKTLVMPPGAASGAVRSLKSQGVLQTQGLITPEEPLPAPLLPGRPARTSAKETYAYAS